MNKPLPKWALIVIVIFLLWGITYVLNALFGICMGMQGGERNWITGQCANTPTCSKPFWNALFYNTDDSCSPYIKHKN